jgi:ribosome modulation factor
VISENRHRYWEEGYNAYQDGVPRSQCPYVNSAEEFEMADSWREGWDDAAFDD